ncbi:MAG: hypothetical protein HY033_06770 [Ignavibacteriae bacterium]|nr:hypothetical protein [Ignavibacteria bacterium]MBI3364595.1 hypothetical protein [Ignavibacteriota bacterium]
MGQQQLLLIIVGVLAVGLAIAVGVSLFGANSAASNKDGVTSSLMMIAADAYHYKIRPSTMGGGSNSFVSYAIPRKLQKDDHGTYSVTSVGSNTATFQGQSSVNTAWVATCTVDDTGTTTINYGYSGW